MGTAFRFEVGRTVACPIGQRYLALRNCRARKMSRDLTNTYVSDAEVLGSGPEEAPRFFAARAFGVVGIFSQAPAVNQALVISGNDHWRDSIAKRHGGRVNFRTADRLREEGQRAAKSPRNQHRALSKHRNAPASPRCARALSAQPRAVSIDGASKHAMSCGKSPRDGVGPEWRRHKPLLKGRRGTATIAQEGAKVPSRGQQLRGQRVLMTERPREVTAPPHMGILPLDILKAHRAARRTLYIR